MPSETASKSVYDAHGQMVLKMSFDMFYGVMKIIPIFLLGHKDKVRIWDGLLIILLNFWKIVNPHIVETL